MRRPERLVAAAVLLALALLAGARPAHAQEAEDDPPVEIGTALRVERLRVTYYTEAGVTYSGQYTRPGSAACSWDLPLYSVLVFADGERVVCLDRGRLTEPWADLWRRPDLAAKYGPYTTVEVVLP